MSSGLQIFDGRVVAKRAKTNLYVGPHRRGNIIPDSAREWLPRLLESLKEPETHRVRRIRYYVDGHDEQGRRVKDSVERWRDQDFCSEVVAYEVSQVTQEMGFEHVTCRTLRHTAGNEVWLRTKNLRAVMDWLGVNKADAELYCVEHEGDSGLDAAMAQASV